MKAIAIVTFLLIFTIGAQAIVFHNMYGVNIFSIKSVREFRRVEKAKNLQYSIDKLEQEIKKMEAYSDFI